VRPAGPRDAVGVEEHEPVGLRRGGTGVARPGARRPGLADDPRAVAGGDLGGRVARSVVDDDDLADLGRRRREGGGQHARGVAGGNDDGGPMHEHRWYHTIELPGGEVTPGYFDTRAAAQVVPLPASLEGKRCLDVGTYDGFWAFEMERRGAAEVVAIDVLDPRRWDWPGDTTGEAVAAIGDHKAASGAFEHARAALGSRVERRDLSVYELSPETVGAFDVVYCGSLTLHLRDPVGALDAIRSVCRELFVLEDAVDVALGLARPRVPSAVFDGRGRPWWWRVNPAGLARLAESAGFDVVEGPVRFAMRYGAGGPSPRVRPGALLSRAGREQSWHALRGDPHAAVLCRPA
jgi:tRNA (mo5U34)-methyltransferase